MHGDTVYIKAFFPGRTATGGHFGTSPVFDSGKLPCLTTLIWGMRFSFQARTEARKQCGPLCAGHDGAVCRRAGWHHKAGVGEGAFSGPWGKSTLPSSNAPHALPFAYGCFERPALDFLLPEFIARLQRRACLLGELHGQNLSHALLGPEARGTKKDKEHALTIEKMNNRDGLLPSLVRVCVCVCLVGCSFEVVETGVNLPSISQTY